MNKHTFTIALILFSSFLITKAQGLYVGLKVGYAFGVGGGAIGSDHNIDRNVSNGTTTRNFDTQTSIIGSYGEGFAPSLQVGYMFSKYVGAELGISYLFGRQFANTTIDEANLYYPNNPHVVYSTNTLIRKDGATSFYINPALVVRMPGESKFIPYAKLGLFIGLDNHMKSDMVSSGKYTYYAQVTGLKSGSGSASSNTHACVGFTATLGADYMITSNIALFGEANLIAASLLLKDYNSSVNYEEHNTSGTYKATSTYHVHIDYSDHLTTDHSNDNDSKTTPVTGDGIEEGSTTTTYSNGTTETTTTITYTNGNNSFSSDKNQKFSSSSVPFSSAGIAIGIRYFFGK